MRVRRAIKQTIFEKERPRLMPVHRTAAKHQRLWDPEVLIVQKSASSPQVGHQITNQSMTTARNGPSD
jgi:hypothetical protein